VRLWDDRCGRDQAGRLGTRPPDKRWARGPDEECPEAPGFSRIFL
jgi:hypothetical protein